MSCAGWPGLPWLPGSIPVTRAFRSSATRRWRGATAAWRAPQIQVAVKWSDILSKWERCKPPGTAQEREDGLKLNCLDSIAHALAHFSANHSDDYGFHNQKWAILSVAHATEAFCNLLLLALDQGHPKQRKYPGLTKAINRLRNNRTTKLSCVEPIRD